MRILFAGGGTAGHVNPAIAVADLARSRDKDCEILFVGTRDGMESDFVPRRGYDIEYIKIHGFERRFELQNFKNFIELPLSIRNSKKIIKRFKPDVVLGTGGYVSGPVVYAAARLKVPTVIHESNGFPGVTTRILARFADTVALGIDGAQEYIKKHGKIVVTGNPVRPSILSTSAFEARRKMGLDDRPLILAFGGSLGARDFNAAVADWICREAERGEYRILMGTGKNNQYNSVMERIKSNGLDLEKYPDIQVTEYIYDMDIALNAADLVVSRAGSTISELTAVGKPAVLVPSPYVAGNHQMYNARAMEKAGAAVIVTEDKLSAESLGAAIDGILKDRETLLKMRASSEKLGIKNAAERIYDVMKELI